MAVTVAWDETAPAGGESPRLGDDRIRELKEAIRMRMRNGGHLWTAAATDTEDGRHVCGTENASGGPGTPLAGEFYVYAADQTTRIVTVGDSTAAIPNRINASTLALTTLSLSTGATTCSTLVAGSTANIAGATTAAAATFSGLVTTNAGLKLVVRTVSSSPVTVVAADQGIVMNTVDDYTVNLPAAATMSGQFLMLMHVGETISPSVTVDPNGAETVDGDATQIYVAAASDRISVILLCDGTSWYTVSSQTFTP